MRRELAQTERQKQVPSESSGQALRLRALTPSSRDRSLGAPNALRSGSQPRKQVPFGKLRAGCGGLSLQSGSGAWRLRGSLRTEVLAARHAAVTRRGTPDPRA